MTNREIIIDALKELADETYQQRVWCGSGGHEMSSFTEAICGLFDDSGLGDALESSGRKAIFSSQVDENLKKLRTLISTIDQSAAPSDLVRNPKMQLVRDLANTILDALIEGQTEK